MTVIFGTFRDIGGELSQGSVTLQSIITRPSHLSSSEVVTTERHEIVLSDGAFTSPELDPGPTRVRFRGHGGSEEWEVVLPEDGRHDLATLVESQHVYEPPVVGAAQAAAQEAAAAATAAGASAERAAQVEATVITVVADGAAAVRAELSTEIDGASQARVDAQAAQAAAEAAESRAAADAVAAGDAAGRAEVAAGAADASAAAAGVSAGDAAASATAAQGHADRAESAAGGVAGTLSLAPAPASGLSVTVDDTRPRIVAHFSGTFHGYLNGRIMTSPDGEEWTDRGPTPDGAPVQIIHPCDDGEVLCVQYAGLYRSVGWSGPGAVEWEKKVTPNGASHFQPYSVNGRNGKWIAADYGHFIDSRYARISTDDGKTWNIVYDSVERYGAEVAATTHLHGVEYDHYADRFYLSEGHREPAGLYVSEDDGATWQKPPGLRQDPSPTVVKCTDDGLVCGSESRQAGLFGVVRQTDPMAETFIETWRWRPGFVGVFGFGVSGHRDPDTGIVMMWFRSVRPGVAPVIAGGTAAAGGLVWSWPTTPVNALDDVKHAIVVDGQLYAHGLIDGSTRHIRGRVAPPGAPAPDHVVRVEGDSLTAGPMSGATGIRATVVGVKSTATGVQDQTAVGYGATAGTHGTAVGAGAVASTDCTAFGRGATTGSGDNSHAIGSGAKTNGGNSIAIGSNSEVEALSVAVGHSTKAGSYGTAIGRVATASANRTAIGDNARATSGDAIGKDSIADHPNSVAIGRNSATTAADQVAIGGRHLMLSAVSTPPPAPAAGSAALYVRIVDGAPKLCVRLSGGQEVVLA